MKPKLHVKNPELLVARIKSDEGCRLQPYVDTVGKTTIGWGRNLTDHGISATEAELMLYADLDDAIHAARTTFHKFDSYPEVVQEVIVCLVVNLGHHGFLGFQKMITAIRERAWETAADELLDSRAARQLPARYGRYADMLRGAAA